MPMREPRFVLLNGNEYTKARNNLSGNKSGFYSRVNLTNIPLRNLGKFFTNGRWRQNNQIGENRWLLTVNNRKRPSNINKLRIHGLNLHKLSTRLRGVNSVFYDKLSNALLNAYIGSVNQANSNERYNKRFNRRIMRSHRTPSPQQKRKRTY